MIDEVEDMLADVVTIEPYVGQDEYGRAQTGAAASYRARVMGDVRKVIDANGEEVVSTTKIIVAGATAIDTRDVLTLPARWTPRRPKILQAAPVTDESGLDHWVVRT